MPTTFSEALNRSSMRPFQWAIVAACMLILVCDGIDLQLLGIVAPLVIQDLGTDSSTFGYAMGAALVGFGVGSWLGGWLGDRIGRRWTLAIAAVVFSLATAGAGTADSVQQLALWRLAGGLGFGAAYANALALAAEWLPDRWRALGVSTLSVGTPIGGTIVGWFGPDLAVTYGWDGTFVRVGFATLLLVVVIVAVLRDSPSFFLERGKVEQAARNARLVFKEDVTLIPERRGSDNPDGLQIGVLHKSNLRLNLGIWIAFAAATTVAYGILSWSTVMLTARGFTLSGAGDAVAIAGLTSIVGSIAVGAIIRKWGSKTVMAAISVALTLILVALGMAVEALPLQPSADERLVVTALIGAAGACFSAAIAGMYVMLAFGYPQSCRATGMGVGILMSRIGAISASGLGGVFLALGGESVIPFFAVLTVSAAMIAAAAFVVDRHIPPLTANDPRPR